MNLNWKSAVMCQWLESSHTFRINSSVQELTIVNPMLMEHRNSYDMNNRHSCVSSYVKYGINQTFNDIGV
jgi:hypothetical protein